MGEGWWGRGGGRKGGGQTGGMGACCSKLHNFLQPPDSLMLASIEARLRRLNKMAQRSAIGLSSLLPTMQQRGAVEGGGNGGGGGEGTPGSRGEQELPEWKFFNKVQCMGGEGGVSYKIFSWGGGRMHAKGAYACQRF